MTMKSAAPRPIGAHILSPFEWGAKSVAWLTNPAKKGGFRFIAYGFAVGCMLIQVETIYSGMDQSPAAQHAGVENPKVLPKPGFPDGANIGYLMPPFWNPIKSTINFATSWLPFRTEFKPVYRFSVWGDPNWYVAWLIGLSIGGIEAMAIRKIGDWGQKMSKFQKLNGRVIPDLNPQAIAATKLAKIELQADGLGDYLWMAILIVTVYGIEFYAFVRSVTGLQMPMFTLVVYALINVFGFEAFWSLADRAGEEKE